MSYNPMLDDDDTEENAASRFLRRLREEFSNDEARASLAKRVRTELDKQHQDVTLPQWDDIIIGAVRNAQDPGTVDANSVANDCMNES